MATPSTATAPWMAIQAALNHRGQYGLPREAMTLVGPPRRAGDYPLNETELAEKWTAGAPRPGEDLNIMTPAEEAEFVRNMQYLAGKPTPQEIEASMAERDRQAREAEAAVLAAQGELARIEGERVALAASLAALEEQSAALEREKAELSTRLQGALSQVADTQQSARGMIVSLPDILFDLNEATLKNEAKVVIAKLAGILLILPELNLRVEGHTDSTGSADYNQGLSERRATSVRDFLAQQGIDGQRMVAVGYGLTRPVADNSTREGRARNRRVEIVIAEGVISEN